VFFGIFVKKTNIKIVLENDEKCYIQFFLQNYIQLFESQKIIIINDFFFN
jgi:hypothetical protein